MYYANYLICYKDVQNILKEEFNMSYHSYAL